MTPIQTNSPGGASCYISLTDGAQSGCPTTIHYTVTLYGVGAEASEFGIDWDDENSL